MKFYIKHESRGRIRIHLAQKRMSSVQAETLLYYLQNQKQVSFAKVYDRTGDAVICYQGERSAILRMVQTFHYEKVELPTGLVESSGRELNKEYQETAYFSIHRIPPAAVRFHLPRFREEYPNETVGGKW